MKQISPNIRFAHLCVFLVVLSTMASASLPPVRLTNSKGKASRELTHDGHSPYFVLWAETPSGVQLCNGIFVAHTERTVVGLTASHCYQRAKQWGDPSFQAVTFTKTDVLTSLPLESALFVGQLADGKNRDQEVNDVALLAFSSHPSEEFDVAIIADAEKAGDKTLPTSIWVTGYTFRDNDVTGDTEGVFEHNKCDLHYKVPQLYLVEPRATTLPPAFSISYTGKGADKDRDTAIFFDNCSFSKGQSGSGMAHSERSRTFVGVLSQSMVSSLIWDSIAADRNITTHPGDRLLYLSSQRLYFEVKKDAENFVYGIGAKLPTKSIEFMKHLK